MAFINEQADQGEQLNVVLSTDYFPPHVGGGVEQATYQIATHLTSFGHNVAVVTLNTRAARKYEVMRGIRVYRADVVQLTGMVRVQSAISWEALPLIRRVCRKEEADILHANNLFFFTTVAACANKRAAATKLVTTMHIGSLSKLEHAARVVGGTYERTVGRWILHESDHIIAVSKAVKKHAEELGQPGWRVSVVPNAVDTEEFAPASENNHNDSVRVAFVGRLVANKGPQFLIEAAPRILRECSRAEFMFVGEGPLLDRLQTRAKQLGIGHKVHFLGMVPTMPQFLKSCDILVRPSLTEGMPLVVLEAMACAVPIVASEVGGTPELLLHGEVGFLTRPMNIQDLAQYVGKLAADDALRSRMAKKARRFVEDHFTWRENALQVAKIYDSISGRR